MTVEEAIKELRRQRSMMGVPASTEAVLMAISALEREKEPQPEQADKDSSKNNSIDNDNTRLKICQDIIDKQIKEILDYYDGQLSDDEQKIFDEGQRYSELTFVQMSLKEENK